MCFLPILKAKLFIYVAGKVQRHKKTMPKREVMVAPSSSGPHMKIEGIVSIVFPLVILAGGKKANKTEKLKNGCSENLQRPQLRTRVKK